jgi:enoyl-CoA hydratase/carnithine racemase
VTLTTPFSRIGISLEGVSSVLFPPIFGPSMTTRLLYLAETVPVAELQFSGVFAGIMPAKGMAEVVIAKIAKQLEDLAPGSIGE